MATIELNLNPDRATLRQFGFIALVGFGLLATCAWFEKLIFAFGLGEARLPVAATLAGLGVLACLFSLVWPRGNWPIFVGLSILAFPIGFVLSHVLLAFLFFVVIAPIGIVMRLLRHDPMHREYDGDAPSYWSEHAGRRESERYFRQF